MPCLSYTASRMTPRGRPSGGRHRSARQFCCVGEGSARNIETARNRCITAAQRDTKGKLFFYNWPPGPCLAALRDISAEFNGNKMSRTSLVAVRSPQNENEDDDDDDGSNADVHVNLPQCSFG